MAQASHHVNVLGNTVQGEPNDAIGTHGNRVHFVNIKNNIISGTPATTLSGLAFQGISVLCQGSAGANDLRNNCDGDVHIEGNIITHRGHLGIGVYSNRAGKAVGNIQNVIVRGNLVARC